MVERTIAFGPASIANVGPFFDVMGYCVDHLGDFVEARKVDRSNGFVLKDIVGPYAQELRDTIQQTGNKNCVEVVAQAMWSEYNSKCNCGIELTLHKYIPLMSGLGSSAASAVATTKAILEILEIDDKEDRLKTNNFMMEGEREVSGHYYPDNIVPSYWGGFHIISQNWQENVNIPDFYTVVILNSDKSDITEKNLAGGRDRSDTGEKRDELLEFFKTIVNGGVSQEQKIEKILHYMRFQARNAARLIHALHQRDVKLFGSILSETDDSFLADARDGSTNREAISAIAYDAGAFGCSISGSGPSIFMITDTEAGAQRIRDAVLADPKFSNAYWLISNVNNVGSITISSVDEYVASNSFSHNFWPKNTDTKK